LGRADGAVICGIHPVQAALKEGGVDARAVVWLVQKGLRSRALGQAIKRARALGIRVRDEPAAGLQRLCGSNTHQGLVLRLSAQAYAELEDVLPTWGEQTRVLILDQVQDPRNVGALIRSALAFDVAAVIVPRDRSAPINADAVKTSAGAALKVPIVRVTNLARCLEQLKEARFWIYGADQKSDQVPEAIDWRGRSALVLGAEGKGLRRLTQKACDGLVAIPHGGIESLNVAVAGGILMYAAYRQTHEMAGSA